MENVSSVVSILRLQFKRQDSHPTRQEDECIIRWCKNGEKKKKSVGSRSGTFTPACPVPSCVGYRLGRKNSWFQPMMEQVKCLHNAIQMLVMSAM